MTYVYRDQLNGPIETVYRNGLQYTVQTDDGGRFIRVHYGAFGHVRKEYL